MGADQPVLESDTRSIAIISDIHGNIRALDAVLADIAAQDVERVVCNGDLITGSAHAAEVVARIRTLGIPCTRGNHERYLAEMDDPADAKWRAANWTPTQHDYISLTPGQHAWLRELPELLWLCDGPAPLVMTHGAPGNDSARLTAQTPPPEWRNLFADFPAGITLVGSHLHWFWQTAQSDYRFVRTPSVGLPLDGDVRAGYVILRRNGDGWRAEHRRVGYDLQTELEAFRASDYYQASGIVGHLFWEELRTARWWLMPFFAHLRHLCNISNAAPGGFGYSHEDLAAAWQTFDHSQYPEYNPDQGAFPDAN
ncbi:MAG: metallophosphatase family protein [Caldilineales bacterium]|nr:metallophosphatase family protein [Caldilineales bacterium]